MINSLSLLFLLQAAPSPLPGVEFRVPEGWTAVEAPPLRVYAPPGLGAGQLLMLTVWPAERVAPPGTFATWFERKLILPGETILQQTQPERRPAHGLDVLTATLRVTMPQGGQVVRVVYAISAGERVALAMLTSSQDQLVNRYANEARGFFESLRFASPPAGGQAAIPPAGFDGSEPRGLFYRLQAGAGTTRMETRTRIFLPSKRVLRIEPVGGGDMIDLGRCSPDTCGGYQIEGPWLTVRWDNGDTRRLSYARSGDGFTLDGETFQPARGLSAAEAAGTWSNPGGGNADLQLKGDGNFMWGAGTRETTLRGRYELQGLSLVLHFSDGTSRRYTLFAAGRTRPAGLISFDGSVYSRR